MLNMGIQISVVSPNPNIRMGTDRAGVGQVNSTRPVDPDRGVRTRPQDPARN